ncbi:MAG: cation:proton antiporter [Anaerolineaceae bacterium]|nr:cation:proton antiporter [Anaerolineaceae bacterium]
MTENHFIPLFIIVILAFVVPVVLSRFKQLRLPIVVGEILAGIVIGRSGFQLIRADEPVLHFLAEFGFVFLMFLSGMEIDFSSLSLNNKRKTGKTKPHEFGPLGLALISFGLTLLLSIAISFALVKAGITKNVWMMALILSTTSLGVVVPVLKEKRLIGGKFGQTLLFAALIADFVTMLLITVMVAVLSKGLTFDILLVGLLFVAVFVVLRFANSLSKLDWIRKMVEELSHATAQIKVRGAFAIMLVFIVMSQTLGVEIILGAFLAGVVFALIKTADDQDIIHQLESFGYGFLIPIFFISVGLDINLRVIFESPSSMLLLPILVLAALAVKFLPSLVFRLSFSWRETLSAGALLSARLSLIIAAAAISMRIGIISETVNATILLVAILTVTLSPLLFSAIFKQQEEPVQPPIIIVGGDELSLQVATQLKNHLEKVVILDNDPAFIQRTQQLGFDAVIADIAGNQPPTESYLKNAQTLVCTYADPELSYNVCAVARTIFGVPRVIARVTSPADIYRFEQLGVTTTNAAIDYASMLVMLTRNPTVFTLLTRTDDQKEVYEVVVENNFCAGKLLRQLNLPGDILILALRRNGDLLVPHGNTRIETNDHLTLVSSLEWIEPGRRLFEPDRRI